MPPRPSRRTMSGLAGAAVLGLLAAQLSAVTADAAPQKGGPSEVRSTQGLRNGVTVAGITEHLASLQAISDANGGNRVSGFGGYDASKNYAVERLEAAGYDVTVTDAAPASRALAAMERVLNTAILAELRALTARAAA